MAAKKTKPFDWTSFYLKIAINASPEKVFRAWTDAKELSSWFTVKTEFEAKKNGRIHFEWLGGDKMDAKVISITKNRQVIIPFGGKGEKVKVVVKKDGKGAVCELYQYDMKTSEKDKTAMHMGCKQGWTFFLTNLKSYLEHGIDLRSHNPKRSYREHFINS